jgi:HSP20 family protein
VRRWAPPTDLTEDGEDLVLRIDLPGMSDEDVTVEVDGNVLTVSGERKDHRETQEGSVFRLERSFGKFSRSFTLPEGTETDSIEGGLENGVLELRVPKPAERQPKRIKIGSQSGAQPAIEGTSTET